MQTTYPNRLAGQRIGSHSVQPKFYIRYHPNILTQAILRIATPPMAGKYGPCWPSTYMIGAKRDNIPRPIPASLVGRILRSLSSWASGTLEHTRILLEILRSRRRRLFRKAPVGNRPQGNTLRELEDHSLPNRALSAPDLRIDFSLPPPRRVRASENSLVGSSSFSLSNVKGDAAAR